MTFSIGNVIQEFLVKQDFFKNRFNFTQSYKISQKKYNSLAFFHSLLRICLPFRDLPIIQEFFPFSVDFNGEISDTFIMKIMPIFPYFARFQPFFRRIQNENRVIFPFILPFQAISHSDFHNFWQFSPFSTHKNRLNSFHIRPFFWSNSCLFYPFQ